MAHLDPDTLILLALGERQPDQAAAEHLRGCLSCARQHAEFSEVVQVGRETHDLEDLPAPAEQVWQQISRATGQVTNHSVPAPKKPAPRRSRVLVTAAAVLLGVALGVGGVLVGQKVARPSQVAAPASRVVATAELSAQPQAPAGAHGTAEIVASSSSTLLRLDLRAMPTPQGLYELWLFDGDDTMIPLTVVVEPATVTEVVLPQGLSLAAYPIVDVSAQEIGQQQHGVSMLRGRLSPAS